MIDLSRLSPVIDKHIDPRLRAVLRDAPSNVHVIFAGPDVTFLDALRRIYGVALPCPDVLVCAKAGYLVVTVAAHAEADGLMVELQLNDAEGTFFVRPCLIFTAIFSISDCPVSFTKLDWNKVAVYPEDYKLSGNPKPFEVTFETNEEDGEDGPRFGSWVRPGERGTNGHRPGIGPMPSTPVVSRRSTRTADRAESRGRRNENPPRVGK